MLLIAWLLKKWEELQDRIELVNAAIVASQTPPVIATQPAPEYQVPQAPAQLISPSDFESIIGEQLDEPMNKANTKT